MTETAFVVGHTGMTGRAICKMLAEKKCFSKVALLGRRVIETTEYGPEFESKKIDFSNLSADDFKGFDQGFCTLGATSNQGKEAYRTIDRDSVIKVAENAKQGGCKHFHLVTAKGSSSTSRIFALRMKGEAEEAVQNLTFDKCSIYRPSMILFPRKDNTLKRQIMQDLSRPFEWCAPSTLAIPIEVIIAAVHRRIRTEETGTHFYQPQDMLRLSKEQEK